MKSYVLGLSGSPRERGNSRLLLEAAMDGVRERGVEAKQVFLTDLVINPCLECGGCDETGSCVLDDDMSYVCEKIEEAQGLIISTPVFFGHLPAQLKAVIDRFQAWWVARYVLGKPRFKNKRPAGLIVVGGMNRPDYFDCIKKTIKAFYAVTGFRHEFELYFPEVDEKGAILKRKKNLKSAWEVGASLAEELKR